MSSPSNDTLLKTQRQMAWERAKGELRSMMVTFWCYPDRDIEGRLTNEQYHKLDEAVNQFITKIEDEGLQE